MCWCNKCCYDQILGEHLSWTKGMTDHMGIFFFLTLSKGEPLIFQRRVLEILSRDCNVWDTSMRQGQEGA